MKVDSKFLYATSALFPSKLANRIQILSMAHVFHDVLGSGFFLGVPSRAELEEKFNIVRIQGSLFSFALAWRYVLYLRREKVSYVYCREERLLFFIYVFSRLLRVPAQFYFEVHWIRNDFFFNYILKHADGFITITRSLMDVLNDKGIERNKILSVPDGVDLARYNKLPDRHKLREMFSLRENIRVIGYTGSLFFSWKGVDVLLQAASQAPQNWFFWIVGGNSNEITRFQQRVKCRNVRFQGQVPFDSIPAIQAACDVLVLPNKTGDDISEKYTSPMKLFEYMASGVPIVASDLPSTREILNESNSVLVSPDDPEALVKGIRSVLEDGAHSSEISMRARSDVEQYTWNKRAEHIVGFISSQKKSYLVSNTV